MAAVALALRTLGRIRGDGIQKLSNSQGERWMSSILDNQSL